MRSSGSRLRSRFNNLCRSGDWVLAGDSDPFSNIFSRFLSCRTLSKALAPGLGEAAGLWAEVEGPAGAVASSSALGFLCRALRPILGLLICRIGEEGAWTGEGGVEESLSDVGWVGLARGRGGLRRPGPELSEGVGGSPLLQAMLQ